MAVCHATRRVATFSHGAQRRRRQRAYRASPEVLRDLRSGIAHSAAPTLCNSKGLCALLMGYFTSIYLLRKVGATTYNRSWSVFICNLWKFYFIFLDFGIFLKLRLGYTCFDIAFTNKEIKNGYMIHYTYMIYFPRRSRVESVTYIIYFKIGKTRSYILYNYVNYDRLTLQLGMIALGKRWKTFFFDALIALYRRGDVKFPRKPNCLFAGGPPREKGTSMC